MKQLSSLIHLLAVMELTQPSQRTPVYIGGFFPLSPNKASVPGQALLAAAELALDHVNKSDILRDYELRMIVKDSKVRMRVGESSIPDNEKEEAGEINFLKNYRVTMIFHSWHNLKCNIRQPEVYFFSLQKNF